MAVLEVRGEEEGNGTTDVICHKGCPRYRAASAEVVLVLSQQPVSLFKVLSWRPRKELCVKVSYSTSVRPLEYMMVWTRSVASSVVSEPVL